MDWVPAHFPKDIHGLAEFDGTDLYEHMDPRQGEQPDWGTLVFNFGRNEVRNFLIANALFWLDQYHIDGLRVDAVASMLYLDYSRKEGQWIPNVFGGRENLDAVYFLKRFNEVCYERFPGHHDHRRGINRVARRFAPDLSWRARVSASNGTWAGCTTFCEYMQLDPIFRRFHHGNITFSLLYAFQEHFVLVLSHDEVVHGKRSLLSKMPGDVWQKFANLRMFYAWMFGHPGKKLLFMGGEFGQWREWNHDASLDWGLLQSPLHDGLRRLVQHLNYLYKSEPALWDLDDTYEGFEWIDFHDAENSVVAWMRKSREGEMIVFIVNATPVVRYQLSHWRSRGRLLSRNHQYRCRNLRWRQRRAISAGLPPTDEPWQGREHSLYVNLPPLATVALKKEKESLAS